MTPRFILLAASAMVAMSTNAHVTLPAGGAAAGTEYLAAFRVGHPCKDASATTAIRVRIPTGFLPIEAVPRAGWKVTLSPTEVTWTADAPETALQAKDHAQFTLRGRLPSMPTTLWFKVQQVCDTGSADWAEIPTGESHKPEFPAMRLEVR